MERKQNKCIRSGRLDSSEGMHIGQGKRSAKKSQLQTQIYQKLEEPKSFGEKYELICCPQSRIAGSLNLEKRLTVFS